MKTVKIILFLFINTALMAANAYLGHKLLKLTHAISEYKEEHLVIEGVCLDSDTNKEVKLLAEQVTVTERKGPEFTGIVRSKGVEVRCLNESINITERIGVSKDFLGLFLKKEETKLVPLVVRSYDQELILSLKNKDVLVDGECKSSSSTSIALEGHPILIKSVEPIKNAGLITGKSHINGETVECDIGKVSYTLATPEDIYVKVFNSKTTKEKVGDTMVLTGECTMGSDTITPFQSNATLISYNENEKDYHFVMAKRNVVISAKCKEGMFAVHPLKKAERVNERR